MDVSNSLRGAKLLASKIDDQLIGKYYHSKILLAFVVLLLVIRSYNAL